MKEVRLSVLVILYSIAAQKTYEAAALASNFQNFEG